MKIKERRFHAYALNTFWESGDLVICSCALYEMFDLPDDVNEVWLSLYTTPAENRAAVEVGDQVLKVESSSSGGPWEWWYNSLYPLLHPYIGKTLYLQCEYMG